MRRAELRGNRLRITVTSTPMHILLSIIHSYYFNHASFFHDSISLGSKFPEQTRRLS